MQKPKGAEFIEHVGKYATELVSLEMLKVSMYHVFIKYELNVNTHTPLIELPIA